MAVKKVIVLLGQSNMEGQGDRNDLPASLRGVQANRYIFNYENNAREVLNVDGAGPNLPNNTTGHVVGAFGPEMTIARDAQLEYGEVDIFKYSVNASILGPSLNPIYPVWNVETPLALYQNFITRWNAFVALMTGLGHTLDVVKVFWFQGDSDTFVEGNDLAYYGLYKRLIKEIRAIVKPSLPTSVRWISGLTHYLVLPSGPTIFLVQRAKNVRAAQMRAGWDDPNYRVFDSDGYTYKTDLIHLDSQGLIDIGEDMWASSNLTYNNSMALEEYDLASIRGRLADDFGIDLTKQNNVVALDKKINDGISWIVNRRKNWPWLERDGALNVGEPSAAADPARYGAGIFTMANSQVPYCTFSDTPITPRELVDQDGEGREGIMCVSISSNTMLLKHMFRGDAQVVGTVFITVGNPTVFTISLATVQGGTCVIPSNVPTFGVLIAGATHTLGNYDGYHYATRVSDNQFSIPVDSTTHILTALGVCQVAREFRIAQSHLELPDDFIRNITCHSDEETEETTYDYIHPSLFEREIRSNRIRTDLNRIYTVVADPLNLNTKKYLAVYPYFLDRKVLYIKYYGDAKKLVGDGDVPDVPRSDRFVVLYAAGWFVAQWQKDNELLAFYRDSALNELERMTKEYQLSDDITEDLPTSEDKLTTIRGPEGFPEFEEP